MNRYHGETIKIAFFHVPGMKKNFMLVAQLTSSGQYVLFGLQDVKIYRNFKVHGCQYGKAHQFSYEESKFKAKESLELIHTDVFGPVKQPSIGENLYIMAFIDDFSAEAMKTTSNVINRLPQQRKGWRCFDPTTGNATHLEMLYLMKPHLGGPLVMMYYPNYRVFKKALEDSHIQLTLKDDEASDWDQNTEGIVKTQGDYEEEVLQTKKNLSIHFQMKEIRNLKHFLGLEVDHSDDGMCISIVTSMCCDDAYHVTSRFSTLAGCDRRGVDTNAAMTFTICDASAGRIAVSYLGFA
ncbi:hypothetical protein Tco_1032074 [Tanacetum coccineum]|uniref:Uncharacterized protein n=1 Tax=Tanacetum coccineum TaxID=301880 RepID=A0ABQ5GCH7_9ASTR